MVIVITGVIGIGKTTVCEKVLELVRDKGYSCGGILTLKTPDSSLSVQDIQSGQKETLASTQQVFDGPRTPRFSFNPVGIDFGIRAIVKGSSTDLLIVDEIGPLELEGEGFVRSLELIESDKARNSILVIRKPLLPAFLAQLNKKTSVFETTISNRNRLPMKIYSALITGLTPASSIESR